jgi:hypothetical protein
MDPALPDLAGTERYDARVSPGSRCASVGPFGMRSKAARIGFCCGLRRVDASTPVRRARDDLEASGDFLWRPGPGLDNYGVDPPARGETRPEQGFRCARPIVGASRAGAEKVARGGALHDHGDTGGFHRAGHEPAKGSSNASPLVIGADAAHSDRCAACSMINNGIARAAVQELGPAPMSSSKSTNGASTAPGRSVACQARVGRGVCHRTRSAAALDQP